MVTAEPKRRVRLDLDARRAQLLALGRSIFASRAYDEVSVDELAKAAGISKGLLYHYFPTKRDLYIAGLRETAEQLVESVIASPSDMAPLDRVKVGLHAFLSYVSRQSSSYLALMRGGIGSDPQIARIIQDTREQLIARMFTDLGARIPVGEPLLRIAIVGWFGMVEAASLDWLAHGGAPQQDVCDVLVSLLVTTLSAAHPAGVPH